MSETPSGKSYFSLVRAVSGIEFVRTGNEVLIVPLTAEGEVILTIEPSAAFSEPTLILPGGETEQDEEHTATARRELQEEIGYDALRLDFLAELRPYSKYLSVRSCLSSTRSGTEPATR